MFESFLRHLGRCHRHPLRLISFGSTSTIHLMKISELFIGTAYFFFFSSNINLHTYILFFDKNPSFLQQRLRYLTHQNHSILLLRAIWAHESPIVSTNSDVFVVFRVLLCTHACVYLTLCHIYTQTHANICICLCFAICFFWFPSTSGSSRLLCML